MVCVNVMDFTEVSLTALRVFRAVAEQGTFTAAAGSLGYTQSAVSRQIAAIERAAGAELLERRRDGVRLTAAGRVVMRRATVVLDEIEATARELSGLPDQAGTVRLGWFPSAGAALVPRALAALRRTHPGLEVVGREGGTPALVRALRAGESSIWRCSGRHRPSVPRTRSRPRSRCGHSANAPCVWQCPPRTRSRAVTSSMWPTCAGSAGSPVPPCGEDRLMGVWPGLDERPEIAHTARDWLAKLQLVAAGCGLTTVPAVLALRRAARRARPPGTGRAPGAAAPGPGPPPPAAVRAGHPRGGRFARGRTRRGRPAGSSGTAG